MDQVAGYYRRRVGDVVVTALNDGHIDAPVGVLQGITPVEAQALLDARFVGPTPRLTVNGYLVQGGGRTVLIDAGAGGSMGPGCGRLVGNLAAAGVQPETVDLVLLTHFHGDHSGGLTVDGQAVFPRAELAFAREEAAFWFDDAAMAAAPEAWRMSFSAARAAAAPYRTRELADGEAAPGITRIGLPGHTPGHSGYRIGAGPESLLIWGDVMHVPVVQSARPEVYVGYDWDPVQAVATRRAVLAQAAAERQLVAGMHLAFPGFSHVVAAGAGYELVPEPWLPFV